jgi:DNA-binding NarL/FixJ family response regulator
MEKIQVLIVEDEPVIAENIAYYLTNHNFNVCGIAYDAEEAKGLLEKSSPDAIVLDINLQGETTGLDIAAYVNMHYAIPFVLLTSYADRETIEQAKKVKPWGYIVKPFNENTLLASLEMAISNFAQTSNQSQPEPRFEKINKHLLSQVSEREFDVLKLIYAGQTNQQIGDTLAISVNTVKKHINSAYLKLDVVSRTTAIARLRELMLL